MRNKSLSGKNEPTLNIELRNLPKEKWKDVPGFEDLYQLSSYGRVKSLARWVDRSPHRDYYRVERIIKGRLTPSITKGRKPNIDIQAKLHKDGKRYYMSVARLVYYLFVKKFDLNDHTIIITRKDGNKLNCHYKNLQLKTVSEVALEGFVTHKRKNMFEDQIKSVTQYDLEGKRLKRFASAREASEKTGIFSRYINDAARIKARHAGGFYWRYNSTTATIRVSKFKSRLSNALRTLPRSVQQLSLKGKVIKTYDSVTQAARAVGSVSSTTISYVCQGRLKTCKGYRWKYV